MVDLGLQPTITAASAADVGTHETTPSSPSPTVLHVDKDFDSSPISPANPVSG